MEQTNGKNTAQEILDLIIKISFYDEFDDCISEKAHTLIHSIKNSSDVLRFKAERSDGKTVIKWHSFIGEDVAFYANKHGFFIDDIHLYKASSKRMKIPFKNCSKSADFASKRLLEHEVEKIKEMFVAYSPDIEKYFKKDVEAYFNKHAEKHTKKQIENTLA